MEHTNILFAGGMQISVLKLVAHALTTRF